MSDQDGDCFRRGVLDQVNDWMENLIRDIRAEHEDGDMKQMAYLVTAFGTQLMSQMIELKYLHLGVCPGCGETLLPFDDDEGDLFDWDAVFGSDNN